MTLGDVRGQDRALGLLERAISSKRLAHAFVFAGPPGVGKRSTALALARAKVCTEAPDRGCGRCAECLLVSAGTHPDVFVEDPAAVVERSTTTISVRGADPVEVTTGRSPRGPFVLGDPTVAHAHPITQDEHAPSQT